jgi:hypothetical protein
MLLLDQLRDKLVGPFHNTMQTLKNMGQAKHLRGKSMSLNPLWPFKT